MTVRVSGNNLPKSDTLKIQSSELLHSTEIYKAEFLKI